MNKTMKTLLIALVLLYVISPVDGMPGPIDDLLVTLLGIAGTGVLSSKSKAPMIDKSKIVDVEGDSEY